MRRERCKRVREHGHAVLAWPIWQLQPWLVAFIAAVTVLYLGAVGAALVAAESEPLHDLWLFGALLGVR